MKKQLFYMFFHDGENYEARPEYGYKKEFTAEDGEKIIIYIYISAGALFIPRQRKAAACALCLL